MAKRKKAVEINRKEYDRIRKMDRNSMDLHISGYYERGYAAGYEAGRQQAAPSFNLPMALEEIRKIKGIGEAKLRAIHIALVAAGAEDKEAEKALEELEKAAGGQQPEKI